MLLCDLQRISAAVCAHHRTDAANAHGNPALLQHPCHLLGMRDRTGDKKIMLHKNASPLQDMRNGSALRKKAARLSEPLNSPNI
jgi:hypothetical protein